MEVAIAETRQKLVAVSNLSARAVEDYDLVKLAVNGDQRAFAELMNRYQYSVYHTIFKMVRNENDAEDLTIEAFAKAFKKLDSYVPNYAFSTWLFRIAINNCIDHTRKKRIKCLSMDESFDSDTSAYSHNIKANTRNPEDEMMRQQCIGMMKEMVERLGDKYRIMIQLRYYKEKSYEEIATQLNLPLGTVKAQLHRAKELLYGMLTKPGPSAYLDSTRRYK
ncbi:MAG: sigma-70 family RNA polymerase sigma factor [Bacteroidetes bacterium]|nr:MAG: sigma-70 family RNA polymerase sigma factor [Bacteroidota bacterium]